MIWHAQLGYMRSLVDSNRHHVSIPYSEDTSGRTRYRLISSAADAQRFAREAWGIMRYREGEIVVRPATEADIALFARVAQAETALKRTVTIQPALW